MLSILRLLRVLRVLRATSLWSGRDRGVLLRLDALFPHRFSLRKQVSVVITTVLDLDRFFQMGQVRALVVLMLFRLRSGQSCRSAVRGNFMH